MWTSKAHPLLGAILMVLAGASFATVNVGLQALTMRAGVASTTAAFWQYLIASVFSLPLIFRLGLSQLGSNHYGRHIVRVILGVIGIQFWVAGLAHVPIWQAIALVMLSPFFVTIGARFLLGEHVNAARWGAVIVGFVGGVIILAPWSDAFSFWTLLPVLAAFFWAGSSVLMKTLTSRDDPDKVTLYLLVLMTPINAVFAFVDGGFTLPSGGWLWILLGAGGATALANVFLTRAYAVADASFVQPFDHLKLPLNVLAGWLVFQYVPSGNLWVGAGLIVLASLYIVSIENRRAS